MRIFREVSQENILAPAEKTAPRTLPCYHYDDALKSFSSLLKIADLDLNLAAYRPLIHSVEKVLDAALLLAFQEEQTPASDHAHLFLQRMLYYINRMNFFWYDDLRHYDNERSTYIFSLRNKIETAWQAWELASFEPESFQKMDISNGLRERVRRDLEPQDSESHTFFRYHVGRSGYRRLLEIASLDALVEASQLSRILGGTSNEIHTVLTRLFLEEYGNGNLSRKHSSYFKTMMTALDMKIEAEAYFEVVPWQVLAGINHSFLLSERKRYFLRYIGGLLYTEVSVPGGFRAYLAAAKRMGFSKEAMAYWHLHIKEDERHGRWMLNDVALPLVEYYPNDAWELALGYDQQRSLSCRSARAVVSAARAAEGSECLSHLPQKTVLVPGIFPSATPG